MPKIKNVSGEDRVDGFSGRLVLAGQSIPVDASLVYAYTCQATIWAPNDDEAQAAHDDGQTTHDEANAPAVEAEPADDGTHHDETVVNPNEVAE